ncbi:MAG: hypothetical protein CMI13_07745 [Oleibacter sp.]|nr:hypothetical protein [Thalassolituus sp.]
MTTPLHELAKAVGVDPGPLNQSDLIEGVCIAALHLLHQKDLEKNFSTNVGLQYKQRANSNAANVIRISNFLTGIIKDSQGVAGYHLNGDVADWDEFEIDSLLSEPPALAADRLKQEWNCPPAEYGTNRYGLDMAYFRNLFNRELNRSLADYRPDELARNLLRMACTADRSVIEEAEFTGELKAKWQSEALTTLVRLQKASELDDKKPTMTADEYAASVIDTKGSNNG